MSNKVPYIEQDLLYREYPSSLESEFIGPILELCKRIEKGKVELVQTLLSTIEYTQNIFGYDLPKLVIILSFIKLCERMRGSLFWRDNFAAELKTFLKNNSTAHIKTREIIFRGFEMMTITDNERELYNLVYAYYFELSDERKGIYAVQIAEMVRGKLINTDFMASLHLVYLYMLQEK